MASDHEVVVYRRDGRIGRITLNRPEAMNAIDGALSSAFAARVEEADADPRVHVLVIDGAGKAFCAGYDLTRYAEGAGDDDSALARGREGAPWDPIKDYVFMSRHTRNFMALWRATKPSICKVHGYAVAGGSDIALCADVVLMAEDARIGYMPARVWGVPTTAMWVYRVGMEKAKRMLLTGDVIDGREAAAMGLVMKAVPSARLDAEVEALAQRMASVPINQLAMQKMVINQAIESMGMGQTQRLATILDGVARHSPEGEVFRRRSEDVGWKQAVRERDQGLWDWTADKPLGD